MDEIEKLTDFLLKYSNYTDRDLIKEFIQKHLEYKTVIVVYDDDNEVIAVCRWNMLPSGKTANILDLIIRPDKRKQGLMGKLLLKGWQTFPEGKWIVFEKGYLSDGRIGDWKQYKIEDLLKEINKRRY